jgi:hypothetical protein
VIVIISASATVPIACPVPPHQGSHLPRERHEVGAAGRRVLARMGEINPPRVAPHRRRRRVLALDPVQ